MEPLTLNLKIRSNSAPRPREKRFSAAKPAERKKIEGLMEDELRYSKISGAMENAVELAAELMKLAKNRKADLQ